MVIKNLHSSTNNDILDEVDVTSGMRKKVTLSYTTFFSINNTYLICLSPNSRSSYSQYLNKTGGLTKWT